MGVLRRIMQGDERALVCAAIACAIGLVLACVVISTLPPFLGLAVLALGYLAARALGR